MHRLSRVVKIAVLMAGVVVVFILVSGTADSSLASPAPQKSAQDVYLDKCAVCHAKDDSGNTAKGRNVKAKDLRSAEIQKMSDAELIDAVAKGKGKDMDGFEKEMGSDMVKQLVAYCRTLAKR